MSHTSLSIIEGPYLRDILDQPQALEETIRDFRANRTLFDEIGKHHKQARKRVLLTGMGSSLHALYPLELKLVEHGECVTRVDMSELIHSMPKLINERTIIIAVSQSGQSAEVVRLLELNNKRAPIIAVTNTADSLLASHADLLMLTRCGVEFSVSTKTYLGSLIALETLGAAWCGQSAEDLFAELQSGPAMVSSYLARWREHTEKLVEEMSGISQFFIVGRGRSLAACETGALITKESTRWPAEAMSSAAFRHGPMEMIGPQRMVLVLEGESTARLLNNKLAREICDSNGRAELIGPSARLEALRIPDLLGRLLPIAEILPIQMLTLALAAGAGFEAGRFIRATKVTTEE